MSPDAGGQSFQDSALCQTGTGRIPPRTKESIVSYTFNPNDNYLYERPHSARFPDFGKLRTFIIIFQRTHELHAFTIRRKGINYSNKKGHSTLKGNGLSSFRKIIISCFPDGACVRLRQSATFRFRGEPSVLRSACHDNQVSSCCR